MKLRSSLPLPFVWLLAVVTPASSQDLRKVIDVVDELETSLRASISTEAQSRHVQVDSLSAELHALEVRLSVPAEREELQALRQQLTALAQGQEKLLGAVQPKAETADPPRATSPVSLGADMVSRYIWRGVGSSDSPAIQPYLTWARGPLTVGAWGSVSFTPAVDAPLVEQDLSLSLSHVSSSGAISGTVTDYHYPSAGIKYFNYQSGGRGAHTVDVCLTYTGSAVFPISLLSSVNIHNDPDHAFYAELSYPATVNGIDIKLFAGGTSDENAWYAVSGTGFHFINLGLSAQKSVSIGAASKVPVAVAFILNPYQEVPYLVLTLSL
jgi:hypothetical protein